MRTRLLTYDDLCLLPADGSRYEIIDGELLVSPSPGLAHQRVSVALILLIGNVLREHRLGWAFHAPVDVRLSPYDVVQPDLIFIRHEQMHIYKRRGDVQGSPDLAVEIISPSSEIIDLGRKLDLYARTRVAESWLVNPFELTFRVFTLHGDHYVDAEPVEGRFRSVVIPGLVLDPAALFATIDDLERE